ncbi:MAG: hypothetical protein RIB84_23755 [Sneathiellaceae bacterium]
MRPDLSWAQYAAALARHSLAPEGPEGIRDRITGLTCHTGRHRRRDDALAAALVWATCRRVERGILPAPRLAPPPFIGGLAHA